MHDIVIGPELLTLIGGGCVTLGAGIKWLLGYGGQSAKSLLEAQRDEIQRLSERISILESRIDHGATLISTLQEDNARLRAIKKKLREQIMNAGMKPVV